MVVLEVLLLWSCPDLMHACTLHLSTSPLTLVLINDVCIQSVALLRGVVQGVAGHVELGGQSLPSSVTTCTATCMSAYQSTTTAVTTSAMELSRYYPPCLSD